MWGLFPGKAWYKDSGWIRGLIQGVRNDQSVQPTFESNKFTSALQEKEMGEQLV